MTVLSTSHSREMRTTHVQPQRRCLHCRERGPLPEDGELEGAELPPLEIRDDQELLRALCGDELVQIRDNICLSRACPLFSLISPLSLASLIVR